MQDFVELTGASGVQYRFHRVRPEMLPSRPGNFAIVKHVRAGGEVVALGRTNSLQSVVALWTNAAQHHDVDGVYIHFNTTRQARERVHDDLAARYTEATLVAELEG